MIDGGHKDNGFYILEPMKRKQKLYDLHLVCESSTMALTTWTCAS